MKESPLFARIKSEGKTSTNPLKESFTRKLNLKMVLLALFGATMGQGVIWYTGQFYAQSFIENTCKINFEQSRTILLWAIVFATPFFIVFGSLSDRIGRKWIMLLGMLLGVLTYRPIYQQFLDFTSVANKRTMVDATKTTASSLLAKIDEKDKKKIFVTTVYDSVYTNGSHYKFTTTDTLFLNNEFVRNSGSNTDTVLAYYASTDKKFISLHTGSASQMKADTILLDAVKVSAKPNVVIEKTVDDNTFWKMVLLVFIQIIYVTMVYGPIAAFLVELFPTRIRYTSMSLPYHIGNGVFGGLVPFLSTLIIEYTKTPGTPTGSPLAGLWYPIGVASVCFVIGLLYLSNKKDEDVSDDTNVYVH